LVNKVNFYPMYKFEFDTNKSCSNFNKHGGKFIDAQELWADLGLL
jgi:uncharacterized DUF497 family protein